MSRIFSCQIKFIQNRIGAGQARKLYINEETNKVSQNFIIKPYIEGKDLNQSIKEVTNSDILKNSVVKSIINDLENFHKNKSRIHRDIKPANIIIHADKATIIDDDISSPIEGDHTMNVGTPEYGAPELFKTRKYNEKADIYSLGMVIYFIETSRNPYDVPREDIDWLDEFSFQAKHSLWYHPSVTSVFVKNIIQDCINPNPQLRPTLEELSRTIIFPSERCDINKEWKIYSTIDEEMTKSLSNDLYSSISILILSSMNKDCDFAVDTYSSVYLQLKILLNGYFFMKFDLLEDHLYTIDDIGLLDAFCHRNMNQLYMANKGLLAIDPYDTIFLSMINMHSSYQNCEFFIQNCDYILENNDDWDSISLVYIFSGNDLVLSYIEVQNNISSKFRYGKNVAKNLLAASYYSIKYLGVTDYVSNYVRLSIDDKDDIIKNISLNVIHPNVILPAIGYYLNEMCPRAFDYNELLELFPRDTQYGSFVGLYVFFIAYLNSCDDKYLEIIMVQYRNILKYKEHKNYNNAFSLSFRNADGSSYTVYEYAARIVLRKGNLLHVISTKKYPIVMLVNHSQYIGFRSLHGEPIFLSNASQYTESVLYGLDAFDALIIFFKQSVKKKMNIMNDWRIFESNSAWNRQFTVGNTFGSKYENNFANMHSFQR